MWGSSQKMSKLGWWLKTGLCCAWSALEERCLPPVRAAGHDINTILAAQTGSERDMLMSGKLYSELKWIERERRGCDDFSLLGDSRQPGRLSVHKCQWLCRIQ